jgi:hypothetical protein
MPRVALHGAVTKEARRGQLVGTSRVGWKAEKEKKCYFGCYAGRQHFMVVVHARGRQTGQSRSQVGRHGQGAGVNRVVRRHAMEKEVVGLVPCGCLGRRQRTR